MDNKAPDAFRTISEVAVELDLPQHVLRFWESRFNEIKPMKRGGGRRYYRPDDVDLLRGIRHLLYGEGYTIRGVQRILREQGIHFVQSIWQEGAEQVPPEADEDEHELADDTVEIEDDGDEADDEVEEAEEPDEPRGLRDRITSLIGRDLNERGVDRDAHQEPPLQNAPMPRIEPGDRFGGAPEVLPAPRAAKRQPESRPEVATLSEDQLDRLRHVLDELKECRKLIDAAPPPADR